MLMDSSWPNQNGGKKKGHVKVLTEEQKRLMREKNKESSKRSREKKKTEEKMLKQTYTELEADLKQVEIEKFAIDKEVQIYVNRINAHLLQGCTLPQRFYEALDPSKCHVINSSSTNGTDSIAGLTEEYRTSGNTPSTSAQTSTANGDIPLSTSTAVGIFGGRLDHSNDDSPAWGLSNNESSTLGLSNTGSRNLDISNSDSSTDDLFFPV